MVPGIRYQILVVEKQTKLGDASLKQDSVQDANLENILAEMSKMSKTVVLDVSIIKGTTEELKNALKTMQERITEVEG